MKDQENILKVFGVLASSFFPTPRVGQTPKVTNHDSMEAASPEKLTENEGILLAVWRTPVPSLFNLLKFDVDLSENGGIHPHL